MKYVNLVLVFATLFVMLPTSSLKAAELTKESPNTNNNNVLILTNELASDIGVKVEDTFRVNGEYFEKDTTESKDYVVYSYSNTSNGFRNKLHGTLEANSMENKLVNDKVSAPSAWYCGYYYDFAFWIGTELAVCGNGGQTVSIARLSSRRWGNDDITSILHTHSQVYTELYEHDNYRGWRFGTGWDVSLLSSTYNNRASSMKVYFP